MPDDSILEWWEEDEYGDPITIWGDPRDPILQLQAKGFWTTREGHRVPFSSLSNSHLLNIIKFIRRQADRLYNQQDIHYFNSLKSAGNFLTGDHALDSIEQALDFYGSGDWGDPHMSLCRILDNHPAYRKLQEERIKRELSDPTESEW